MTWKTTHTSWNCGATYNNKKYLFNVPNIGDKPELDDPLYLLFLLVYARECMSDEAVEAWTYGQQGYITRRQTREVIEDGMDNKQLRTENDNDTNRRRQHIYAQLLKHGRSRNSGRICQFSLEHCGLSERHTQRSEPQNDSNPRNITKKE